MTRLPTPGRRPRTLALAAALATGALILPAAAPAGPPLTDRYPVEAEFDSVELSDACGLPVTIAFVGTFAIKVFTAPDGSVREIDTQPGTKVTFSSATGSSALPFSASLHADYPEGVAIGAPARLSLTGRSFGTDDLAGPGSGRLVLEGTVVAVEDGFPFTRFTELISTSGQFTRDTARICAALVP